MKKIFLIIFILFAAAVYAEDSYPVGSQLNIDGSALGWDDTAKKWRPIAVDANGNLKTDSGETTQEISVDTSNIESYLKKTDGTNVTTLIDYVEGLAKTAQPNEFRTARLSNITANTATQINAISDFNSTASGRVFVELRAINTDDEFYIGFGSSLTDSNGRPVKGRILLSMPASQNLYIYHTNASAIDIQQTEGWR